MAKRILVVEDEQLVALDIERRLERLGYEVALAASGEAAVKEVEANAPDLVLMDVRLDSEMDGIETAAKIHEQLDVPIIYLTAYADADTLARARRTEPYGYLLKPFKEQELRATVEMAIERSAAERARLERERVRRFLSESSNTLVQSLDYDTVVERAAELLVPRYADWCLLHIEHGDGSIPPLWFTHPPPEAPGEDGEPWPPEALVLPTEDVLLQDPAAIRALLGPSALARLPRRGLQPTSLLSVPISSATAGTLGTLILVSCKPRAPFGESEHSFAQDFAHRLGMAIDNAVLYRRAQNAIRAREEVLAIVAHDLRNPLGAILIASRLLLSGVAIEDSAAAVARCAARMNALISDLLDAASIDAGRFRVKRAGHEAITLVAAALEATRPLAEGKSVTLTSAVTTPQVSVDCDFGRILQVLVNLVGNSIKFTPRDGAVEVRVTGEGQSLRFSVRDTGPGIDDDHLPHLFKRFWRANSAAEGSGLGLYIAKGIVDAHGATLSVDTRMGQGSTFHFSLPVCAAERAEPAPPRPSREAR